MNISNEFAAASMNTNIAGLNSLANMGGNMKWVMIMTLASVILLIGFMTIKRFRWAIIGAITITLTCGPIAVVIAFSKSTVEKAAEGNLIPLYAVLGVVAFLFASLIVGRFVDEKYGDKIDAWFESIPSQDNERRGGGKVKVVR